MYIFLEYWYVPAVLELSSCLELILGAVGNHLHLDMFVALHCIQVLILCVVYGFYAVYVYT